MRDAKKIQRKWKWAKANEWEEREKCRRRINEKF